MAGMLNLGKVSTGWLAEIGVHDLAGLKRMGAAKAYLRIKANHPQRASVLLLYALHGALANVRWNEIPEPIKAQMRAEVDAASKKPTPSAARRLPSSSR